MIAYDATDGGRDAVALGADAPEVTDGVQWFRTDADGEVLVESQEKS